MEKLKHWEIAKRHRRINEVITVSYVTVWEKTVVEWMSEEDIIIQLRVPRRHKYAPFIWTDAIDTQITDMYKEKCSLKEIWDSLWVAITTIRSRLIYLWNYK